MDNSNNSASPVDSRTYTPRPKLTICVESVNDTASMRVRRDMDNLLSGCAQVTANAVHDYLSKTEGADAALLAAWAAFGRKDRRQTVDISVREAARRTLTPLGLACLVSYARAWLDEADAIKARAYVVPGSSSESPDGGSKCRKPDQGRRSPARATARRKRKR